MDPSTSPTSNLLSSEEPADSYSLEALRRFYRFHAAVYDWTRPFILFGRRRLLASLALRPGMVVFDVGCGTGWSLPHLGAAGASVVCVETSPEMRARAHARAARLGMSGRVRFDPRPYGSHGDRAGQADVVLFSYSLSMIPPYAEVLARARDDLRPGGTIAVVDFLTALAPEPAAALRKSHVHLGMDRLDALRRLFPNHQAALRNAVLWRYFQFLGTV
jgi:S-adenosylmethionine-diacylgycerolhomoserine-N-methlytransferase